MEDKRIARILCSRDCIITILVIISFGLIYALYDVHKALVFIERKYPVVTDVMFFFGLNYLFAFTAVWWLTVSLIIEAVLIHLHNYWKWVAFTYLGVVAFVMVGHDFHSWGYLSLTNFIQGITVLVPLSIPWVLLFTVLIFIIKKNYLKRARGG